MDLTGRARTDEEIQEEKAKSEKDWGSEAGPGWLKPCLEHILSAQDPLPAIETDGYLPLVPLAADDVPRLVPKAQIWLQKFGYDPGPAHARVCAEIDRLALEDARRERLYKLIFSGRYELMGYPHRPNPHRRHIPRMPIPTFELRRVSHTMGRGCHGMGELGPIPATSMKVFFNTTLFGTKAQDDLRPTYLEVIIKRTDVLALKVALDTLEKQAVDSGPSERAGEQWPALGQSDHANGNDAPINGGRIPGDATGAVTPVRRKRPARERAAHALEAIYKKDLPTPECVPDWMLCKNVADWLASQKPPWQKVSDDSVLREAGRRLD